MGDRIVGMKNITQYTANLLSDIKEKNIEDLTFDKLKLIFLMAIKDFKEGKLQIKELSAFSSGLVEMPEFSDDEEMKELKEVIYFCSEINFYLHQIPEVDKDGTITISFILKTMEYYQKNKIN